METSFQQLEADFQRKLNEYESTYKDYMVELNQQLGSYWNTQENVTVSNKGKDAMLPMVTMPDISKKECLHSCSGDPKCKYVLFSDSGNGACAANQCLKWTKAAKGFTGAGSAEKEYSIYVGSSNSNPKIITLPDVGINVSSTPTNYQDPNWSDTFSVSVSGNQLTVTRVDQNSGWGQILELSGKRPATSGNLMENKACVAGAGPAETNYKYVGWEKPDWKDTANVSAMGNPDIANMDDWKSLGSSQTLSACKEMANASDEGPFSSIVFFSNTVEGKWKNKCYGGVPSATMNNIGMSGAYSSIPPMGSTNLGGSAAVQYVVKLRNLNDALKEDIRKMTNMVNSIEATDEKTRSIISQTHKNLMIDNDKLNNDRKQIDLIEEELTTLDEKLGLLNLVTNREKYLYFGSLIAALLILGYVVKRYS